MKLYKTFTLTVTVAICFSLSAYSQTSENCRIKQLIEDGEVIETMHYSGNKLAKRVFENDYIEYLYNDSSELLEKQNFYHDNEMDAYKLYHYNSKSQLIKLEEFELYDEEEGFEQDYYSEFEYDSQNRIIQCTEYALVCCGEFEKNTYTIYTYDNDGNIRVAKTYSACCGISRIYNYKYDKRPNPALNFGVPLFDGSIITPNNRIKTTVYNEEKELVYKGSRKFTYRKNGLPQSAIETIADDKYTILYQYTCD